jgi:hypothetical protein
MLGGALLRSPLGQQFMSTYKDSQAQLAQNKTDLEKAREDLKPPARAATESNSAKEISMSEKPTPPTTPPDKPTEPPHQPPQR